MDSNSLRTASRLALLLLALTLTAAPGCSRDTDPPSAPPTAAEEIGLQEVEIEAPDFALPIMNGGDLTLSDLRGKIVLLNFWQLNCPPCKEEMPWLDAVGKAFKDNAHVVALNIGDSETSIQQYFDKATLNMTVPYDRSGQVAALYRVGYTPTTFLIDTQGIIRYVKVGAFASYGEVGAAIEFTRLKEAA